MIAAAALGDPERYARGFFETTGKEAGTGAYTQWCAKGIKDVADAAVLIALNYWRDTGQVTRSQQVAELAWNAGPANWTRQRRDTRLIERTVNRMRNDTQHGAHHQLVMDETPSRRRSSGQRLSACGRAGVSFDGSPGL